MVMGHGDYSTLEILNLIKRSKEKLQKKIWLVFV